MGTHGFWVPEVSFYRGKFYVVYAVDEHVAIAVATKPEGSFEKIGESYLTELRAVDGHLFFDDDGNVCLYYVRVKDANRIYVAKMADDLTHIEYEYDEVLIEATEAWEIVDCKVAEGPFVLKHNGLYYLIYSANHTRCKDYAVGYAVSASPFGPFKKSKNNPVLHKFDDVVGAGHHSFMSIEDENTYLCVYHCHGGDISGFKERKICLAEAVFVKDERGKEDDLIINQ